jgi:hypothetical protein
VREISWFVARSLAEGTAVSSSSGESGAVGSLDVGCAMLLSYAHHILELTS